MALVAVTSSNPVTPSCNMTLLSVSVASVTAADTVNLTTTIAPYGRTIRGVIVMTAAQGVVPSAVDYSTNIVTIGTGPSAAECVMLVMIV